MGSLMAGWDSPIEDPKVVKLRRNSSSTKDEIDAFWRARKKTEEEHLKDISALSPRSQMHVFEEDKQRYQRSSFASLPDSKEEEEEVDKESFLKTHGWWISSNWAFLNEPPVIVEGPKQKYVPQFHVAKMALSKIDAQTGVGV